MTKGDSYSGVPAEDPIVLRPSRMRSSIGCVVGLFLLLLGLRGFLSGPLAEGDIGPWIGVIIGAFVLISSALQFVPGVSFLKIDRHGVTHRYTFREKFFRWQEIEGFSTEWVSKLGQLVAIYGRLSDGKALGQKYRLTQNFGLTAEALLNLLEQCKMKYSGG